MLHAKITNGVVTYPYTLQDLYKDFPDTSFPHEAWPGDIESFSVATVLPVDAPVPTTSQVVVETTPALVNGVWTQQWLLRDKTTQELADDAEKTRVAAIDSTIGGDNIVTTLKGMTNQQFDDWWTANVTNASQAINVLKRVTRIVIRRVL